MPELDDRLRDLGSHIEWPATPDVMPAVRARLTAGAPRRGRRTRALLVLAALVATLGGGLAASPEARSAILRLLRLRGATVERVDRLPVVTSPPAASSQGSPGTTPTAVATALAELGEPSSLDAARARVPFPILVPRALGAPDVVRVQASSADRTSVSLLYAPRSGLSPTSVPAIGLLLSEYRGSVATEFIGKLAGPGTRVERVEVDGEPGVWLEGEPHFLFHRGPDGEIVEQTLRLSSNTLLWERGELLLRIEARLDLAGALRVATSLGP